MMDDDYVFVNLCELVKEDSEEVLEIKSLYQREEEYSIFLGPIEFFIANYYYHENRKLSDVRLIRHLRNVKNNFDKDLEFFGENFEAQLMNLLSRVLQNEDRKICRHELKLVLSYILWSIDNRKYMGDKRAYLKWICGFFGISNREDKAEINGLVEECGKMFGKSAEVIESMKGNESECKLSDEDIRLNKLDSEGFVDDDGFWSDVSLIESIDPSSNKFKEKMKYFKESREDEILNFECRVCRKKIGEHNLHWHDGCCDDCFFDMMNGQGDDINS